MNSSPQLFERIESHRSWLQDQPDFLHRWSAGCDWVLEQLDTWITGYVPGLFTSPPDATALNRCRIRMWDVWAYHWRQAADQLSGQVSGSAVAEDLRQGIRPLHGPSMGGDPLQDAVLVEGCLLNSTTAWDQLLNTCLSICEEQLRQLGHASEISSDILSSDVISSIPLDRFHGYGSLRTWLRIIIRNRIRDSIRKQQARRVAERKFARLQQTRGTALLPNDAELADSLGDFLQEARDALAALSPAQLLALYLRYHKRWKNHAIAMQLGVSDGHASRLHDQALEAIQNRLGTAWQDELTKSEVHRSIFAEFLFATLADAQKEKS